MTPSVDDLVELLARGILEPHYTGLYEHRDINGTARCWRVWRRGRLARIEDPPGTMTLIAGHRTYWRRWPSDTGVVVFPRVRDHDGFELSLLTMLDTHDYWRRWLQQDTTTVLESLRPVESDGRDAWRFVAPEVKGGTPTVTVDAGLGLVLCAERPGIGVDRSWTQLQSDVELGDALFRHDGDWQFDPDHRYPTGWLPE